MLSAGRCESVLASARKHLTEENYFAWLDAMKPYTYLQTMLDDKPSRFADVFDIG